MADEVKKLSVGDTVRLKSGGPIMTVSDPGTGEANSYVQCVWYTGSTHADGTYADGKFNSESFFPATLTELRPRD